MITLRRGYADTHLGQLHFSEAGSGPPLLLLHQTPRSMDEFADVMPFLARNFHVISMDMVGFGLSPSITGNHSIELMAEGGYALLDYLNINNTAILGHHTGGAVAIEMAARSPHRVTHLCISSTPWTDADFRSKHSGGVGVDEADLAPDGSHLTTLWSLRAPYYPRDRPDILNRFIRDALAPGVNPVEGHLACARYVMEERIGNIIAPTILIGASDDPFSMPDIPHLNSGLVNAVLIEEVVIPCGRIPLMEEFPQEVAEVVTSFISRNT